MYIMYSTCIHKKSPMESNVAKKVKVQAYHDVNTRAENILEKWGGLKSSATPRACIRARARDRTKLDRRERGGGALPPRPKKWGGWSTPCPP